MGHQPETEARGRGYHDLHGLPPPLEVLAHHQGGGVPHKAHPDTDDDAVAEDDLVELTGEGGEQTAEGQHEAAHHRRDPGGLPLTHRHRQGGDEERHRY